VKAVGLMPKSARRPALFAGAAVYVSLVEHRARIECGTRLALNQFGPSYRRATVMQASLAITAFVASTGAWLETSRWVWLAGGILIGLVVPFALLVIVPTNKKLLDPMLSADSDDARRLLKRWGSLHWVRTLLSLAATVIFLSNIMSSSEGIRRAREAVLRRDLFTLRQVISQYTLDKQKPPQSLDDLVRAGYLKQTPVDPMTGRSDTWKLDREDAPINPVPRQPLISLHSGSDRCATDGTAYNTW
jgi:competence protein ComGC